MRPKLSPQIVKDGIIKQGVVNLKEFGYPDVDEENIFTDAIYSKFFSSMLDDNLGKGFDAEIGELQKRIKQ